MIKYMKPTFIVSDGGECVVSEAMQADRELQEYFGGRKEEAVAVPQTSEPEAQDEDEEDPLPF